MFGDQQIGRACEGSEGHGVRELCRKTDKWHVVNLMSFQPTFNPNLHGDLLSMQIWMCSVSSSA